MNKFRETSKKLYDKYLLYVIILFAFLTMLTYVFRPLRIGYDSGVAYRIVLMCLIGIIFIIGLIVYKKRPPLHIIIGLSIYTVGAFLALFISPYLKSVEIPVSKTLQGVAVILSIILTVISFEWLTTEYKCNDKTLKIIGIIMLVFGCFIAIYTYIFEWKDIRDTFIQPKGWDYDVTSIFEDKTSYGFMLVMCSMFTTILALKTKKYWLYAFVVFFLLNMFLSRSKTSIICTTLLLIVLLIYHTATSFNAHKKAWIISYSVAAVIILTFCIFTFVPACRIGPFESIYKFISETIIGDGITVMSDRFYKWGKVFKAMDHPFLIIFGCGERIANDVLTDCGCATIGDSIYVSNYGTGGIIKFTLYLALAVVIIIYNFKKTCSNWKKFLAISIEIILMISGFFEDDNLVGVSMTSLFMLILFYLTNQLVETSEEKISVTTDTLSSQI